MKFVHTNIVTADLSKIVNFYVNVFDCKQVSPESKLAGDWVEEGTKVVGADLRNINLKLPGYGEDGPTLEIFQYANTIPNEEAPMANKQGLRHLAFQVENVDETVKKLVEFGGKEFGKIVRKEFRSGTLTYTYATDPDGNLIEVQSWQPKQ